MSTEENLDLGFIAEQTTDDSESEQDAGFEDFVSLSSEMGVSQMVLTIFHLTYKKVTGRNGDDDFTVEDVESFKKYLLGGGENWKSLVQGSLMTFYNLKDNGVTFTDENGVAASESDFVAQCNIIKEWIERNGGVTKYGGCFIATAVYGSYDCPQVWTLRRFRDQVLENYLIGRIFIRVYYSISPVLVSCFGETNWFIRFAKPKLNQFVKKLNQKGISDNRYID